MVKKIFAILLIAGCPFQVTHAQTISRSSTSSAGGTLAGGGNQLTFTIGETVIPTLTAGGNMITQGFQQPGEQLQTGTLSSNSFCAGSTVSIPYSAIDIGGGNSFTAQLSDASGSFASPIDIGSASGNASGSITAVIPPNTVTGSAYRIRLISSFPALTATDNVGNTAGLLVALSPNLWIGGNGNWSTPGNWCATVVPVSNANVLINAGNPQLDVDYTVAGTLSLAGTGALTVLPLKTLDIANGGNASFDGRPVTFKSDITGYGSLGQVNGTLTGATNATVERYIPHNVNKSWRLLASNTMGQTINQAWQEGVTGGMNNPNPGFGTMITSSGASIAAVQALGFDTLSLGKSLFKYNPATDNLDFVANTNTTPFSSEPGYFLFIRGDRRPGTFNTGSVTAPASATVLRSTGTLYTGTQPSVSTGAGNFGLVRNPYPSRIDMRNIVRSGNLVDAYQVWDSKLGGRFGVGGFQTFTKTEANYVVTPGGGSYGGNGSVSNFIESGAAFFIQSSGGTGTATVTEACKVSGSNNNSFRPSGILSGTQQLLYNLYAINSGSTDMVDGGIVFFDPAYSNAVDVNDVRKSGNFNENFGMLRNGTELVVEKRNPVLTSDSVFFRMYQLKQITYRIDMQHTGFVPGTIMALLQDRFSNTFTPLDITGLTSYTFTVNNSIPASVATDRFRILYTAANIFSGTGNWTDNARWSRGAPPAPDETVIIAEAANAALNTDYTVAGKLTMMPPSTLTVNPARTLAISGIADLAGQSVTFRSDGTGYGSLGQVTGTLTGATNVTVERYIPNNGFRSWRLLSVPTFGSQTIRQSWQENNAPLANGTPNFGTLITDAGLNNTASTTIGFDAAAGTSSLLRWNGSGWTGAANTLSTAVSSQPAWFLFVRGERSKGVTGASGDASATTLRTNGTVYTGSQSVPVSTGAFSLVGNLYPSAINFTQLVRSNVNNTFYVWDSKKLSGNSLGAYQTFSGTNGFLCQLSGGSYTLGQPNTTIESGQAFFVMGGTAAGGGSITLLESSKISGTNGNLGFRPAPLVKIDSRLYNKEGDMRDANTVVFSDNYSRDVDNDDAPKLGNPAENFAVERNSRILAIEGTLPLVNQDTIQFRMWNLQQQEYKLQFIISKVEAPGMEALLEDSYLNTMTALKLSDTNTVAFNINTDPASAAANRFRIVFRKTGLWVNQGYTIAPNPVTSSVMNLQFNAQPAGKYTIQVFSSDGKRIYVRDISHAQGSSNYVLPLPNKPAAGIYTVKIMETKSGQAATLQMMVE